MSDKDQRGLGGVQPNDRKDVPYQAGSKASGKSPMAKRLNDRRRRDVPYQAGSKGSTK